MGASTKEEEAYISHVEAQKQMRDTSNPSFFLIVALALQPLEPSEARRGQGKIQGKVKSSCGKGKDTGEGTGKSPRHFGSKYTTPGNSSSSPAASTRAESIASGSTRQHAWAAFHHSTASAPLQVHGRRQESVGVRLVGVSFSDDANIVEECVNLELDPAESGEPIVLVN